VLVLIQDQRSINLSYRLFKSGNFRQTTLL